MPSDSIIFFIIIPLLGSFFAFLEKIRPTIHSGKPAVIAVYTGCFLLLASYAPAIMRGERYESIVGNWSGIAGIYQTLDGYAWIGLAVMYCVSALSVLFAFAEKKYDASFYFFFLVLVAGMAGVLLASDLFNLFVCLEIVGICSYILISFSTKDKALWASFKYLVLSTLGISLFLVGVFLVYKNTGTLFIGGLAEYFSREGSRSLETSLALACIFTGIGVRTAFVPFHTWLPDAHAFAPHPVSAILSGVVIKVSFLALWRIIIVWGLGDIRLFLLWGGVITAVFGVILALMQTECKLLLAWHTVSQMGYIMAGFGAGTVLSMSGSLYHLVSHALFKSLLFLSVGTAILNTGKSSIKEISGLARSMPLVAGAFCVGALSIAGIPPFNGYISKKFIFTGITDHPAAYWSLWAVSAGTAASFIKLSSVFRGKAPHDMRICADRYRGMKFFSGHVSMLTLALLCLASGLYGPFLLENGIIPMTGHKAVSMPSVWKAGSLFDTGISIVAGVLLFLFIRSKMGETIRLAVSRLRLSLDGALVLILSGLLILTVLIYHV